MSIAQYTAASATVDATFKTVNGKRKVVGTKKVHRCIVPRFAFTSLTVTYSAS